MATELTVNLSPSQLRHNLCAFHYIACITDPVILWRAFWNHDIQLPLALPPTPPEKSHNHLSLWQDIIKIQTGKGKQLSTHLCRAPTDHRCYQSSTGSSRPWLIAPHILFSSCQSVPAMLWKPSSLSWHRNQVRTSPKLGACSFLTQQHTSQSLCLRWLRASRLWAEQLRELFS